MLSFLEKNIDVNKLSSEVKILFEIEDQKVQFIKPITCNAIWNIDNGLIFKKVSIEAIGGDLFSDLISEISTRNKIIVNVFIGGLLFIRSWITEGMISYYLDKNYGVIVEFTLFDRFIPLKISDIIKTKPQNNSSLIQFLGNVLEELDFLSKELINTYTRPISKGYNFIKNGVGINSEISLKTFKKDDFLHDNALNLIGECLCLSNVLLSSNGYDTLTIEKPNADPFIIGVIDSEADNNISYIGKVGDNNSESSIVPSSVIILNSITQEKKNNDNNTAFIGKCAFGLPNITKINNASFNATYKQLESMIDYNFAGIKAQQDSFLIKIIGKSLTDTKEFYQPNRRIKVYVPKFGLDENMVILQMGLNISAQQGVELTLNVSSESSFENNASLRQKVSLMR